MMHLEGLAKIGRRVLGLGLGALFVYAGVQKNLAVAEFAEDVLAYQLLPEPAVGAVAAILPWLEIVTGSVLILGFLMEAERRWGERGLMLHGWAINGGLTRRSCLALMVLQLGVFILVLLFTMARGLKIDCGCGLFMARQVGWGALQEDAALLLAAGWLYYQELRGAITPDGT